MVNTRSQRAGVRVPSSRGTRTSLPDASQRGTSTFRRQPRAVSTSHASRQQRALSRSRSGASPHRRSRSAARNAMRRAEHHRSLAGSRTGSNSPFRSRSSFGERSEISSSPSPAPSRSSSLSRPPSRNLSSRTESQCEADRIGLAAEKIGLALAAALGRVPRLDANAGQSGHGNTYGAKAIPEFDPAAKGADVSTWLVKVDQLALIHRWSSEATAVHATAKLVGAARTWYESLPNLNLTWSEWKIELAEAFPLVRDHYELTKDLMARRKKVTELVLVNACGLMGK